MKVESGKILNLNIKKIKLKLFLWKNFYQEEGELIVQCKTKMDGDGLEASLL